VTVTSAIRGDTASLSVHNWGEPIAPEVQASLFEPMVRGGSMGSAARSVGLGLFIVRAIARAHGGDVRVSSSQVGGSTFTFSFPRG
jgi:sigma-B regulation protein RsbU (phosphoserine phosphatase)